MKTYFVFVIQAYDTMTEAGQLMGYTELQLIESTPEDALKRAKKMIKKNGYRIANIIEKFHEKQ